MYFGPEHQPADPSQDTLQCHASLEPFAAFSWLPLKLKVQDQPAQEPAEKVNDLCSSRAAAKTGPWLR